jgi:hypothetical protein
MRPKRFVVRSAAFLATALLCATASKAQATDDESGGPRGSTPRPWAESYHSHAQRDGVSVGAELLTPKQVHKVFVADLNRCCLVVEFAFYPNKDKDSHELSLDDFALFLAGSDIAMKPESAKVVAARLQKKASPQSPGAVQGGATVGYESGTYTDPVTGQQTKVHSVYTETDVGVGVGNPNPAPDSTARDREVMAGELDQKGLPEGKTAVPVAGYLYFSIPQRKKDAKYQLECSLNGEKLVLSLP